MNSTISNFLPEHTTTPRLKLGAIPMCISQQLSDLINKHQVFRQNAYCIDDLAASVGTNRLYMSRIINLTYGMNYNQFINYCRVEFSKHLLLQKPQLKQIQIALESGFSSVAYYNRVFKGKEGILPKEWRLRALAGTDFQEAEMDT